MLNRHLFNKHPVGAGVLSALSGIVLLDAPLHSSLSVLKGIGQATFSRAGGTSNGTVTDFEGRVLNVKPGEARFQNVRRVENICPAPLSDDSFWLTVGGQATVLSETFNGEYITRLTPSSGGSVIRYVPSFDSSGKTMLGSVFVRVSRPLEPGDIIQFYQGSAGSFTTFSSVNSRLGVFSVGQFVRIATDAVASVTAGSTLGVVAVRGIGNSPLNVDVVGLQYEDITGQTVQEPSEPVSVGVGTQPELVEDPGFDDPGYWAGIGATTVAGGVMSVYSTAAVGSTQIRQTDWEVPDQSVVKISFEMKNHVQGYTDFEDVLGTVYLDNIQEDGVHTVVARVVNHLFPGSPVQLRLRCVSQFVSSWLMDFDLDNISIQVIDHGSNVDGVKYFPYHNRIYTNFFNEVHDPGPGSKFGRRVENLVTAPVVDMPVPATYVSSPATDPWGGSNAIRLTGASGVAQLSNFGGAYTTVGRYRDLVNAIYVRKVSGTITDAELTILGPNGVAPISVGIGSSLTSEWQRFTINGKNDFLLTGVCGLGINFSNSVVIEVAAAQMEDRTSSSDKVNPGEYVSRNLGIGQEIVGDPSFDNEAAWDYVPATGSPFSWSPGEMTVSATATAIRYVALKPQYGTIVHGRQYEFSITVEGYNANGRIGEQLYILSGWAGASSIQVTGNGTYTAVFQADNTGLPYGESTIWMSASSGIGGTGPFEASITGISIREVTADTGLPGVKEFPSTNPNTVVSNVVQPVASVSPETPGDGLVLEGQRINACPHSSDLTDISWGGSNTTLAQTELAPDGTTTGWLLTETSTTANGSMSFNVLNAAADWWTYSVYLRQGDSGPGGVLRMKDVQTTLSHCDVGITWTNGVPSLAFIAGTGVIHPVEGPVFGDWYRVAVSALHTGTGANTLRGVIGGSSFTATETGSLRACWVQMEQGATVSSYIPTYGTAQTRAADSLTYDRQNIADVQGSAFATVRHHAADSYGSESTIIGFSHNVNHVLRRSNLGSGFESDDGVISSSFGVALTAEPHTVGVAWSLGNTKPVYVDGVSPFSPTAYGGAWGASQRMVVGSSLGGTDPWYGTIKDVKIYERAFASDKMQRKTK